MLSTRSGRSVAPVASPQAWTPAQDRAVLAVLALHGSKAWGRAASAVNALGAGGRAKSAEQCRARWARPSVGVGEGRVDAAATAPSRPQAEHPLARKDRAV